jgi:hypothetical protein
MTEKKTQGKGNPAWRKGGKSPNPAGRRLAADPKSKTLRVRVTRFLVKNGTDKKLQAIYDKLDWPGKAKFYTDLLAYGIPKQTQTSLEVSTPFREMSDNDLDRMLTKMLGPIQPANTLQEPLQTEPGQILFLNPISNDNGTNGQGK